MVEKRSPANVSRARTTYVHQVSFNGTTHLEGELDLDAALSRGAESLASGGCTETLDVRRAMATGEIARRQLALDLQTDADVPTRRHTTRHPRQVILYVHLSEAAITGNTTGVDLARVENQRQGVTAEQVRTWCANPDTQIVVKPVIDLAEHIHVDAYEVSERLEVQTRLRDVTCVFPWCRRPARGCDNEHCIPHAKGGTTCRCNIAPQCRRHHRLKTHSTWGYIVLEPGSFLWTSPHGYQYLRDHEGTIDVTPERPPPWPANPPHF